MLLIKSLFAGMCDLKTILCYKKYDRALTSLLITYLNLFKNHKNMEV